MTYCELHVINTKWWVRAREWYYLCILLYICIKHHQEQGEPLALSSLCSCCLLVLVRLAVDTCRSRISACELADLLDRLNVLAIRTPLIQSSLALDQISNILRVLLA